MTSVCHGTLIQISDLHFGDTDSMGNVVYDPGMKTLWSVLKRLKGLAGHEYAALLDLAKFYATMKREDPTVVLLVTGDLTSTGKDRQFQSVVEFVCRTLPATKGSVGLRTGDWMEEAMRGNHDPWEHEAIPGNHDHWPGRYYFILGPPRSRMCEWARHLPFIRHTALRLRGTPVWLRILALNTDADVRGWGAQRVLARGSFLSQLRRLANDLTNLGPPDPNEVRILLLHHSLAYKAPNCALPLLEINEASAHELRQFLARFDIPVILTGHTHDPMVDRFRAFCLNAAFPTSQRRVIHCLEACCGTTTMANYVPAKWPAKDRKLQDNSLLVHRLVSENGTIVWKTETWWRKHQQDDFQEASGFEKADKVPPGKKWSAELVVWPRR